MQEVVEDLEHYFQFENIELIVGYETDDEDNFLLLTN